jgi:hypothetical protein
MAITPLDANTALVIIVTRVRPRLRENAVTHEILELLRARFD